MYGIPRKMQAPHLLIWNNFQDVLFSKEHTLQKSVNRMPLFGGALKEMHIYMLLCEQNVLERIRNLNTWPPLDKYGGQRKRNRLVTADKFLTTKFFPYVYIL